MKIVRIGRYNRMTKDVDVLASATLSDDGIVLLEGSDASLIDELRQGIHLPGDVTMLTPDDGLRFLEALSVIYRNPNSLIAGPVVDQQVSA